MNRILAAVAYAERAHRGQIRKYMPDPYIVHPIEVAQLVSSVDFSIMPSHAKHNQLAYFSEPGVMAQWQEDTVIAALLHDVVEDTPVTIDHIRRAFGKRVAQLVHEVTDLSREEDGGRDVRKAKDREHLAKSSPLGATIKLADMISNTQSITFHDPAYAKAVYIPEKRLLLPALAHGHPVLYQRAWGVVEGFERGTTAA